MRVLVEPGLVAFRKIPDGEDLVSYFEEFWRLFELTRDTVQLNGLELVCSAELYEFMGELFPYDLITADARRRCGALEAAAGLLLKFLDRHLARPGLEWAGLDAEVTVTPQEEPPRGVYEDENLRIAWLDLVAQMIDAEDSERNVLRSHAPYSFAPDDAAEARAELGERASSFRLTRVDSTDLSPLLSPTAYRSLQARVTDGEPTVRYEDSGHPPPISIQRALERTASAAGGVVRRVNTSYRTVASDRCKLRSTGSGQIEFTISDGDVLFKGQYTTCAESDDELAVALRLLEVHFFRYCRAEGFQL